MVVNIITDRTILRPGATGEPRTITHESITSGCTFMPEPASLPERPALQGRLPPGSCLLTLNAGSSSLKFAIFSRAEPARRLWSGRIDRMGSKESSLDIVAHGEAPAAGDTSFASGSIPGHAAGVERLFDWLKRDVGIETLAAVGHRVVHGGPKFTRPQRITPELVAALRQMSPFDPDHLPVEIELIETVRRLAPGLTQIACFDTAFHRDLPRVARLIPIPRRKEAEGVRRYGFHGLSYTYLMKRLEEIAGPDVATGRVILAHLGSGASMAAVRGGAAIDTTMGLTPTSGLVMGTRTGDIDPGLVSYLWRVEGMTIERFHQMVNRESGLLGLSGTSADVRDLLEREAGDVRAAEALALFCYRARKAIGALAVALEGIDTLVFSGGIGEHSPEIRARISAGLGFLGIALDPGRNTSAGREALISTGSAPVKVWVIPTDEERTIADDMTQLMATTPPGSQTHG